MTSQNFPTGRATQPVRTPQEAAYIQARDRQDEIRDRRLKEKTDYWSGLIEAVEQIGRVR